MKSCSTTLETVSLSLSLSLSLCSKGVLFSEQRKSLVEIKVKKNAEEELQKKKKMLGI